MSGKNPDSAYLRALAEQSCRDGHQDRGDEDLGDEDQPEVTAVAKDLTGAKAQECAEDADDHGHDAADGLHARDQDASDETDDDAGE